MVFNKIDLLDQRLGKNELKSTVTPNNDEAVGLTKSLMDMVNAPSTRKSEPELRTNEPLTNVVNQALLPRSDLALTSSEELFSLSASSGEGFDGLLTALEQFAARFLAGAEQSLVTRARHRDALAATLAALGRAEQLAGAEDLMAEELRTAAYALGRLTGRVDVEDVLDVIFRDFCIGK
jgi:tRNA U34 5-carboxymethylaminomethyl modifying GTPase MnmE/TrmE